MAAVVHHVDSPGSASGSGGGSEPSPTPAGSEGLTVSSEPSSTPSSGTTLVASSNLHAHPAASSSTNVGVFVKMARQRSRQSDREKLVPVPVDSAAPAAPEETHAVPPTKEKRNPLARFMKGAQVGRRKASSSQAPPPSQPNSESGPSSPAMSRGNSANGSGTNSGASSSQGHAPVTLPPKVRHVKPLHLPGSKSILGAVMDDWPMFSGDPNDYEIAEPIGYGASSVVYLAHYLPLNRRPCAIKVVDVDRLGGGDVERLKRETQLMSLAKHPNVLRVRGEWIEGSRLFIAVRLMASGSLHDIMRYSFPEGFSEEVVATVLQQVLRGLHYLHINGWIHRDIKAANLLVDDDGTVLVSDFGVSANLEAKADGATDDGKKPRRRTSFVGTPCWMAPEVVEGKGYNDRADIWSFGITALELALGHAPLSLFKPAQVLAKTVSEAAPTLPLSRPGSPYTYSKNFKSLIDSCLAKDPSRRPSAESLLLHPFFDKSRKKGYLVSAILKDLPPLVERQERRRKGSDAAAGTMGTRSDGWDFASTIGRSVASLRWTSGASNGSPEPSIGSVGSAAGAGKRPIPPGRAGSGSSSRAPWDLASLAEQMRRVEEPGQVNGGHGSPSPRSLTRSLSPGSRRSSRLLPTDTQRESTEKSDKTHAA